MPHFVKTFLKMRFVPSEEFYSALSHMPPPTSPGKQVLLRPGVGDGKGERSQVKHRETGRDLKMSVEDHSWQTQPCFVAE